MSLTSTSYDNCAYKKNLQQSTGVLTHIIDENRYVNNNQCRSSIIGIHQNNPVNTNINIDVENDLFGLTRRLTKCPKTKNKFCKSTGPKCDTKSNLQKCKTNIINYKPKWEYKQCNLKKCW